MTTITMTLSSPDVELKDGKGSLAASVTNAGTDKEPVVLGAFPAQSATPPAATYAIIDKPLRVIPAGATEQYVVAFDTGGAPPGAHQVKLIAYSADEAPEDYADQAHVVTLVVPAAEEKPKPRFPWLWVIIGAVALLALIGGVVWFLLKDANVPDVQGRQVADATRVLTDAGFAVATSEKEDAAPKGQVLAQDPAGETSAGRGSTVKLEVATPVKVAVPDILNKSIETARDSLAAAKFELVFADTSACTVSPAHPPKALSYDFCAVSGVEPKPGQMAESGSRVAVVTEIRQSGIIFPEVNICARIPGICEKAIDIGKGG
jgi:hypothetical protein